jgi:hydrogenase expression/formation protein HypE
MSDNNEKILLAHGGGGRLMDQLIRKRIIPAIGADENKEPDDSACIEFDGDSICFTTDSYVVKPLFFNGGDIGKLAICGTVNDLAVAGAKPVAISLSLIIETGFEMAKLERILESIRNAAEENEVAIVTGDTKTVEAGAADEIYINTAGIGTPIAEADLGLKRIESGDKVIINGNIGDHGMTIMSQREGISFESKLTSDCAGLAGLTAELLENCEGIKFMRDPTRGGVAATLNEIARGSKLTIEINEQQMPIDDSVQAAADMLGLDVLNIANEGKFIAVVSEDCAEKCLSICRSRPEGEKAVCIGSVKETKQEPVVEMVTRIGGRRIVQMPYGRELPRIC